MRRLQAITSLALLAACAAVLVVGAARPFPRGLIVAVLVVAAAAAAGHAIRRRGGARVVLVALGVGLALASVGAAVVGGLIPEAFVAIGCLAGALALARRVFTVRARLARAPRPLRPVVIWNPKSGGGKALAADLAGEARARGIEPIELTPGADLVELVEGALTGGADGLAAAGGDGTQAIVASIAAAHDVPFACIPAGTRNHFALDLGVDRTDVVGALDAFVTGGERSVDLAEVNGRTFVNNVSLGLYADAVQRPGYREAKIRTILDTVPDVAGPDRSRGPALRWTGPDGARHESAVVILVSNNEYRLGRAIGSGTRPRLDGGTLGVAAVDTPSGRGDPAGRSRRLQRWTAPRLEVDATAPVAVGVDGEALVLDPPLRFVARPAALRVRIAPLHPGASPSAGLPDGIWDGIRRALRIAFGRGAGAGVAAGDLA